MKHTLIFLIYLLLYYSRERAVVAWHGNRFHSITSFLHTFIHNMHVCLIRQKCVAQIHLINNLCQTLFLLLFYYILCVIFSFVYIYFKLNDNYYHYTHIQYMIQLLWFNHVIMSLYDTILFFAYYLFNRYIQNLI